MRVAPAAAAAARPSASSDTASTAEPTGLERFSISARNAS